MGAAACGVGLGLAVGKGDWLTVGGLPYLARMRYGLPNQSTLFQASTWPVALRRSAAT